MGKIVDFASKVKDKLKTKVKDKIDARWVGDRKIFQKATEQAAKIDSDARGRLAAIGIPKKIRTLGFVLHPEHLQAGDLILVSRKPPLLISKWIIKIQNESHEPEHAKWHHAMISTGNIGIIEASAFKWVSLIPYWKYLGGNYDICVRRVPGLGSEKKGKEIAERAKDQAGMSYGWGNIISILLVAIGVRVNPRPSAGVICSQLFSDACKTEGVDLFAYDGGAKIPPTPAHLHASTQLITIENRWLDLEPDEDFPPQPKFAGYVPFWKSRAVTALDRH